MIIHNVRLGHATNSSSAHSIIVMSELLPAIPPDTIDDDRWYYGWDAFRLTSADEKLRYLATQLYAAMCGDLGEELAKIVTRELLGVDVPCQSHVDHQSQWSFPGTRGQALLPDLRFLKALRSALCCSGVAVCGGNDNDENEAGPRPIITYAGGPLYARQDGELWTLYNQRTGAKLTLEFPTMTVHSCVQRSAPDTLDLKVTNKCQKQCAYCYQGSTVDGVGGLIPFELAEVLARFGVFEVAIGGGEPTTERGVPWLIRDLHAHGIVPAVTTGDLCWADGPLFHDMRSAIFEHAVLGVSLPQACQLQDVELVFQRLVGFNMDRLWIHVIPALTDLDRLVALYRLLAQRGVGLLLLGYKRGGRAVNGVRSVVDDVSSLIGLRWGRLAIDTALANELGKETLERMRVSRRLYRTVDGVDSAYLDLVSQQFGPSSYEPDKMVAVDVGGQVDEIVSSLRGAWSSVRRTDP